MKLLNKIFGDPNDKAVKELRFIVDEINLLEDEFKKMSDDDLRSKTEEFKSKLQSVEIKKNNDGDDDLSELEDKMNSILPEAFACVREASYRVNGQRHYDVQLIGGVALHRGQIAEMRTGEGKTLVATLPLYLNALTGRGAHLVTVNDYLSKIGLGWMAPIYDFLGLTSSVISGEGAFIYDKNYNNEGEFDNRIKKLRPATKKEAYQCDILYGTNNEFGFDYLRDNMVSSLDAMVQRDLFFAIVDEVDSILIDEARTPLIISAPAQDANNRYYKFAKLVAQLKEDEDYNIDEKMRASTLTEEGIAKMEKWLGVDNIYTSGGIRDVHHIEQALKAHAIFKKDKDYVVKDGEVVIVDEFTGRMLAGRRYSEGLHQAIEAKENLEIKKESQTLATITFQNFFRIYHKLSGMTGTAVTEAEEFAKIYDLDTVVIPTHRDIKRKDGNDLIYRNEEAKFKAVSIEAKKRSESGQPVLIGTISIEKNEMLASIMERDGLSPQVLNAKNHSKEARIIAQAGRYGAITIATNMAGRGVDIVLGGVEPEKNDSNHESWKKDHDRVLEAGGLHVIGTERHESRRIDNQLRGRAGRQGDAGSSQFYVSMEDDLMRIFGGDRMKNIMTTLRVPEDMPIENKIISKSIESAQRRVEGNNFDIRKHLVEYDDVINKHRDAIYRRRKNILNLFSSEKTVNISKLGNSVLSMVESEIETVVSFHTASDESSEWNIDEIFQIISTIYPVSEDLKKILNGFVSSDSKIDKAVARTKIIEHLFSIAKDKYTKITEAAFRYGLLWSDVEKSVLLRSIDNLWIEHLDAMSSMRQGIGLRGYGQRDPLVEYKKEAYYLYNELNQLIQKEVVYSIYKIGGTEDVVSDGFQTPSPMDRGKNFKTPQKGTSTQFESLSSGSKKTNTDLVKEKLKNEDGDKVGRNDPCPCGSGKKYKKCCGT